MKPHQLYNDDLQSNGNCFTTIITVQLDSKVPKLQAFYSSFLLVLFC